MTDLGPLRPWATDPPAAALLCDFDGTLAPIVADAGAARPLPAAAPVLTRLAARLGLVAVVSGRPAGFLQERLAEVGPRVHLVGLYGMQWVEGGSVHLAPEVAPWVPVVRSVTDDARRTAPPGVDVEDKGASVVLHWRQAPEADGWCRTAAERWAARTGLAVQPARMAVELRPPVATDKGTVVTSLATGFRLAAYAGDDTGDLAAFDALDQLQGTGGCTAVRVAVADVETPPELVGRADLVLGGPEEFLELLGRLAEAAGAP